MAPRAPAGLPPVIDLSTDEAPVTVVGSSGAAIGWSICGGDFNGDGVKDLAFSWRRSVSDTTPPRISILWSAQLLDSTVDLSSPGPPVSLIDGVNGDGSNWTSLVSGDFNGDGVDDLALGVVNNSQFTDFDGRVYMIFGTPMFPDTLLLADPSTPVTLFRGVVGSGGWLGYTLASGDVNGDGREDLLASAWAYWPGGRVYILHGRESFPAVVDLDTMTTHVTRVIDAYLYQGTGVGLASGDVNRDGYDDVLIGSPGNAEGFFRGTVSFLFGAAELPETIQLSDTTPGVKRFYGAYPEGQLGERVGFGDVNGDGWLDLVMASYTGEPLGCYDCGEIDVVYWNEAIPDAVDLANPGVPMTRLVGEGFSTLHGVNMVVGEVDGDGFADVILKKEPDDSMSPPEWRAVVIAHGSASMPDTVMLRSDSSVTKIFAEQGGDDLGRGLAAVDLDGNAVDDLCIGAPYATVVGPYKVGKVRVFFDCAIVTRAATPRVPLTLHPSYPNPFSSSTTIRYATGVPSVAVLSIFSVRGQRVRTMTIKSGSGNGSVSWDGLDDRGRTLPSGVYFYRIEALGRTATRKMVLLR